MIMRSCLVPTIGALLILSSALAPAHHSFAMFDNEKTIKLTGKVKEFQWTNPHIWVQVMVADPATGKEIEWSIEGGSPNGLSRQGWKRSSIKAGDTVELAVHPLKDGAYGGSLVTVAVNGQRVGS
jgi:hypothetical protein